MTGKSEKALFGGETHPLLDPLCERLQRWRREAGLETPPDLQDKRQWLDKLQEALTVAQTAGVEADLVIGVVARCECWFRVCKPSEKGLQRALKERLTNPHYTPHSSYPWVQTFQVPYAINKYVDRRLAERWEPGASPEMDNFLRRSFLGQVPKLAHEWTKPFLASTLEPLPAQRGPYADWAPWVAATVVYYAAQKNCPNKKNDRRPLKAASAVIEALRGNAPDSSAFHQKKRYIENLAPELVGALLEECQKAKDAPVQDTCVQSLIDEGCFSSLKGQGGQSLLTKGEDSHGPKRFN